MPAYWFEFEETEIDESIVDGCIVAKDWDTALILAENLDRGDIIQQWWLPYPAHPIIDDDWTDNTPIRCYLPTKCKGKTACPHDPACSE